MRLRYFALTSALTAAIGSLALVPVAARADSAARHLPKPRLTISAPAGIRNYDAKVTLTVTLGRTFRNRKVTLYAQEYDRKTVRVASANLGSRAWHPSYTITRMTVFYAAFAGDAHDAPTSAALRLYSRASLSEVIGGSTANTRTGNITYRVFQSSSTITLYTKVSPDKRGSCLEPESEQLDGKVWAADSKYGCDTLGGASNDAAPFTLSQAAGAKYRIRGDYIAAAKDHGNVSTNGSWLYFEVAG